MPVPYPRHEIETGDHATAYEWNAEARDIARHVNGGLDSDNFDGSGIGIDKFENQTFHYCDWVHSSTSMTIEGDNGNARSAELIPVDDMSIEATLPDCHLEVSFTASWEFRSVGSGSPRITVAIGIRVDGELWCMSDGEEFQANRTDGSDTADYNCDHVLACRPIEAGTHTIEGVVRIYTLIGVESDDWEVEFAETAQACRVLGMVATQR